MKNLVKRNTWLDFWKGFDSMFEETFTRMDRVFDEVVSEVNLITEETSGNKFTVKVPTGELKAEDFEVSVDGRTLKIEGKKDNYNVYYRKIFPNKINSDGIDVRLKDGVLTVQLSIPCLEKTIKIPILENK